MHYNAYTNMYNKDTPHQSYYNPNDMQFSQFQYGSGVPNQPLNSNFSSNMFTPGPPAVYDDEDYENEPPLLEETSQEVLNDTDLAGPLVFCFIFGVTLLLAGKIHFNYIYGMGVFGCVGIYLLLKMMSSNDVTSMGVISTLGYCLLPLCLLSLVSILMTLKGMFGIGLTIAAVLWCSISASKLFVCALDMHHQRILVAYPCVLVYSVFALLAVF